MKFQNISHIEESCKVFICLDRVVFENLETGQGHPTTIFGKYLFGRRFAIYNLFSEQQKTCNLFSNIVAKRVEYSDVAHFTTHVRTCLAKNKVARLSFVDGKTRNIAIQLDLQQSCKRVYTFFVTRFTTPQESLHKWNKIFKIVIFRR